MEPRALEIASTMETEQEEWECCIKIGPACPHPRRLSKVVVINKVLPMLVRFQLHLCAIIPTFLRYECLRITFFDLEEREAMG
jgi:hypothetical protein